MSTVIINETSISNINFGETSIRIVTSTLNLCHSQLLNITDESVGDSTTEFILIDDNGDALIENLELNSSNSMLMKIVTSFGNIDQVSFDSVHSKSQLIFIENSFNLSFNEISFNNFSSEAESIMQLSRSDKVSFDGVMADGSTSIVLKIINSKETTMNDLTITNSSKAVAMEESTSTRIMNSNFTGNGMNNTNGGAILLQNSELVIEESTFNGNKGNKGGAICYQ